MHAIVYRWLFNGGYPSTEISPTYVYEYPGVYIAELTVVDDFEQNNVDTIWITVYEATPEEAIEELIAEVEGMNLQQGLDNSLDAKLSAALDALEALNADQRNDAVNKLNALINEVEAQRGKKPTNEEADYLVARAQAIIEVILE